MRRTHILASLLAVLFTIACSSSGTNTPIVPGGGGGGTTPPPDTTPAPPPVSSGKGSVNGALFFETNKTRRGITMASEGEDLGKGIASADTGSVVPGEIFIQFKPGTEVEDQRKFIAENCEPNSYSYASTGLDGYEVKGFEHLCFCRVKGANAILGIKDTESSDGFIGGYLINGNPDVKQTRDALIAQQKASEMKARQDRAVETAYANFQRWRLATPAEADHLYAKQWHYPVIRLKQAWQHSTGLMPDGNPVHIVVGDTGVRLNHGDLSDRLAQGYDFVSDQRNSADNDGRDANPDDPGDSGPSFHGTHVSGTVVAQQGNGQDTSNGERGGVGVAPGAKVVPLRVLGYRGGSDLDIAHSMLYCAGQKVGNSPVPHKDIVACNYSIGGPGFSRILKDAADAAWRKGRVVVAAAGNENTSTATYPASLSSVIGVGSVAPSKNGNAEVAGFDFGLARAPYSNTGVNVDVVAPGGFTRTSIVFPGMKDGILSTWIFRSGSGDKRLYEYMMGTSMASPHVAGIVGLMKAANINLTPEGVRSILFMTARRINGISVPDEQLGYGLVDAEAAVIAAKQATEQPSKNPTFTVQLINPQSKEVVAQTTANASKGYTFNIEAPAGNYQLVASNHADGTCQVGSWCAKLGSVGVTAGVKKNVSKLALRPE